jgi:hypothetical protein
VNAYKAISGLNESLKGILLRGVEHLPTGMEEYDHVVRCQTCVGELRCIFRGVDVESILSANGLYRSNPVGDRSVAVTGRLAEDQDPQRLGPRSFPIPSENQKERDDCWPEGPRLHGILVVRSDTETGLASSTLYTPVRPCAESIEAASFAQQGLLLVVRAIQIA